MIRSQNRRYQLGLSLSGAISAGAYSAGVMDFLLEALDCWEAERATRGDEHEVGLQVMAGASAGGITAAVSALALAGKQDGRAFANADAHFSPWLCRFETLYDTWVTRPMLAAPAGAKPGTMDLLSDEDIVASQPVLSVLNAKLLDEITHKALTELKPGAPKRSYVSGRLHLFLTLSNLRGTPYRLKLANGEYGMMQHADRAHFMVTGMGDVWFPSSDFADASVQDSTKLDTSSLFPQPEPCWLPFGNAALATAAFPIGLAGREVTTSVSSYGKRHQPGLSGQAARMIPPDFPRDHPDVFTYSAVDGGLINNDPFEYVLSTLLDGAVEKRQETEADRGVIMIAPFPNPPPLPPLGKPSIDLISVLTTMMPVLKDQVRVKPEALALAAEDDVGSRFLISPKRSIEAADGTWEAPNPIASGLLGGFGGFVSQRFRDHDFQLGRRNCQRFLQRTFALPGSNPLIGKDGVESVNLIPLLGDVAREVRAPDWPRVTQAEVDHLVQRLGRRLLRVAGAVGGAQLSKVTAALAAGGVFLLGPKLLRSIARMILADLVRRDQIEGWILPPALEPKPMSTDAQGRPVSTAAIADLKRAANARAVLAELLNPSFDLRSVAGIAKATSLPEADVTFMLDQFKSQRGKPYDLFDPGWTNKAGSRLVCLRSDQPNLLARTLGPHHAGALLFAAKTD